LQSLARGFLFEMVELGYSWTTQFQRLRLMRELSAWMAVEGIEPSELTAGLIGEFLASVRACGPEREWFLPVSERQLVDHLRRLGLVGEREPAAVSDPVELLVGGFVEYLVRERGLRDGSHTVWEYRRTARLFLTGRLDADGGGLDRLTAADVTGFVLAECWRRSRRMSVGLVSTLRGLLRFLFLEGLTQVDLSDVVPKVASWRGASLPKALRPRMLRDCWRAAIGPRRSVAGTSRSC
jgi:hypothetical protein